MRVVLILGMATLLACIKVSSEEALRAPEPPKSGQQLYQYWCATCHGPGPNKPGTIALDAKYDGALPAVLDERTDLTPELVRHTVRHGVSVMPFFRKTEISDEQLDRIAQYVTRHRQ